MFISIILVVALFLLLVAKRTLKTWNVEGRQAPAWMEALRKGLVVVVAAALLLQIGWRCIATVPNGSAGIVVNFGKASSTPRPPGISLKMPWSEVVPISTQVQKSEQDYNCASSDQQRVDVRMAVNYALPFETTATVYVKQGLEYDDKIIAPAASESLKAVVSRYSAKDMLQKRSDIKGEVQKALAAWLDRYNIELLEVSIVNLSFTPDYDKAIEEKQIAEQQAQKALYDLTREQTQAQIVKAKAEGERDQAIERAKGEAAALRETGEAQAEFNRKVADSLTPMLIRAKYLERWDGILPRMITGQDVQLLLPLSDDEASPKGAPKTKGS